MPGPNFLLGHGERLTEPVDVGRGPMEKKAPYSFSSARSRLPLALYNNSRRTWCLTLYWQRGFADTWSTSKSTSKQQVARMFAGESTQRCFSRRERRARNQATTIMTQRVLNGAVEPAEDRRFLWVVSPLLTSPIDVFKPSVNSVTTLQI